MTENEKKLADNLAKKANELLEAGADSESILNYVNAISMLKQN